MKMLQSENVETSLSALRDSLACLAVKGFAVLRVLCGRSLRALRFKI
jgi:hypothetical protein